jgi:hypothetical protein
LLVRLLAQLPIILAVVAAGLLSMKGRRYCLQRAAAEGVRLSPPAALLRLLRQVRLRVAERRPAPLVGAEQEWAEREPRLPMARWRPLAERHFLVGSAGE